MNRKLSVLLAIALVASSNAPASVTLLDKDEWKVAFSGFVETDAAFDTTRGLTEIVGNNPVARPSNFTGDNGTTQYSIRNSRFGFALTPPKEGDWVTKGVLEFDFLGATNNAGVTPESSTFNNPTLRARHFYALAENDGWQFLAGQTWTLFGWQPNYFLVTDSVSPVSGVLFQRTAQFTAMKSIELSDNKFTAGLSVVRPAQRDSQVPGLDAGLRWAWNGRKAGYSGMTSGEMKAQPLSLAVSGRLNEFEYNTTADTSTTVRTLGSAIAVDAMLPILGSADDNVGNTLALSGEFSTGQGYGEAFPGWNGGLKNLTAQVAPGVGAGSLPSTNINVDAGQIGNDPNNGLTLVHLQTFNLQLQYHMPTEWKAFVTTGYGQLYSNNIDTLGPSGIIYDRVETYYVNVAHNFTNHFRLAAEYDIFRTTYADGIIGHDNRAQASIFYFF